MKDGFVCQRRFVGHKKKMDFWIIVVCMKYKCQRGLVFQGYCMKILMSMLLYGNCYGGDSCYC